MALLGFIAIYCLAFLVCAGLDLVWQIDAWREGASRSFPRIAIAWFGLAAIGSLVIVAVNSQPRTYEHLGGDGLLNVRGPSNSHLHAVAWVAPLLAAALGGLALYRRRRPRP